MFSDALGPLYKTLNHTFYHCFVVKIHDFDWLVLWLTVDTDFNYTFFIQAAVF